MAGDIFLKEQTPVILTTTGASIATGVAAAAGSAINMKAGGTANLIENMRAFGELLVQWGTITGIVKDTIIGELYLVPSLDGTNFPDLDIATGAIPYTYLIGSFIAAKAPTAAANARFACKPFDLFPTVYQPYLKNISGQTMTVNWQVSIAAARAQYT